MHPDKNPSPEAKELHPLLTSIQAILKDEDMRKRYDAFLAKGFPIWTKAGYFYSKYKPGVGTAVVFILFFISVGKSLHDRA